MWDLETSDQVYEFENAHNNTITTIKLIDNEKLMITCSIDRSIKIWNFEKQLLLHTIENAHDVFVQFVGIDKDKHLYSVGQDQIGQMKKIWNSLDDLDRNNPRKPAQQSKKSGYGDSSLPNPEIKTYEEGKSSDLSRKNSSMSQSVAADQLTTTRKLTGTIPPGDTSRWMSRCSELDQEIKALHGRIALMESEHEEKVESVNFEKETWREKCLDMQKKLKEQEEEIKSLKKQNSYFPNRVDLPAKDSEYYILQIPGDNQTLFATVGYALDPFKSRSAMNDQGFRKNLTRSVRILIIHIILKDRDLTANGINFKSADEYI